MDRVLVFFLLVIWLSALKAQEATPDTVAQTVTVEAKDAFYYQRQAKRTKDPDVAFQLLNKALSMRGASQDDNWVANIRVEMGINLLKSGKIKPAFSEFLTAEKIFIATGNAASRADLLIHMARFYEKNAAWKEASHYYESAQKIHQLNKDASSAANASLHLTDIALIQNDLSKAGTSVTYAVKQYQALENKTGLALSYVKLAEIYRRRKQYKKGEKIIIGSALPFFRSTGYQAGRIDCFDVLGKIYFSQKRYSEAKWFFIQANTQSRELNDVEGIIKSLTNLSKVKIAIGDYNLAKRDLKEAQSLASGRGNLFLLANVKQAYASLYQKVGNLDGSESASERSVELKDSLNTLQLAQAESARTARVKVIAPKKERIIPVSGKEDSGLLVVQLVAAALAILVVILLILKRIK